MVSLRLFMFISFFFFNLFGDYKKALTFAARLKQKKKN